MATHPSLQAITDPVQLIGRMEGAVAACTALFGLMWVAPVVWGGGSVDVSACTALVGLMSVTPVVCAVKVWTFLPSQPHISTSSA